DPARHHPRGQGPHDPPLPRPRRDRLHPRRAGGPPHPRHLRLHLSPRHRLILEGSGMTTIHDPEFEQHRAEYQQRRRRGYITGLREYACWLEAPRGVEAPGEERILRPAHPNQAGREFAAAHGLSTELAVDEEGNASVTIPFGGGVSLHVYGYRDHAATA